MLRKTPYFLILCFLQLALISCNKVSDDSITTEIKARMFSEPLLKSATVNVASKKGIVTITGIVPDDSARSAAERIASQTKGVKQVIDSTTVAAAPAPVAVASAPPPAPEPAPATARAKPLRKKEPRIDASEAPVAPAPAEPAASAEPAAPAPAPAAPAVATNPIPAVPPPPKPITVAIPEGTVINVRTIDPIDSKTNSTGQYFQASLDAPVVVGDQVVLPKGLNARLKLVQASSSGQFKGTSELTVSLDSVTYQGATYTFASSDVQEKGASRGKRSAAVIGGGTALGALIGGLAGGGRGAAIGAGVGAGAGTGVQAATHGQQVKIPSETRLEFTLHQAVPVTFLPSTKRTSAAPSAPNADQTPAPATQQ